MLAGSEGPIGTGIPRVMEDRRAWAGQGWLEFLAQGAAVLMEGVGQSKGVGPL